MPYTENYAQDFQPAFDGMVADTSPATIVSRTVDGAAIPFGRAVAQGPRDHTAVLAGAGAARIQGIAVRSQAARVDSGAGIDAYPVDDNVAILVKGAIWVRVGPAVTRDQAVTVTLADGTIGNAAAGAGVLAIPGAYFETSAAAGALARIRIV